MIVPPRATATPVPGVSSFFTVMFGTGFVTVLVVQCGVVGQPGPVKLAWLNTVVVSVPLTVTENVTSIVWPAGTVTVNFSGVTPDVTVHAPVAGSVAAVGHLADVATKVVFDGTVSVIVSVPFVVPLLVTARVYLIVPPGFTATPVPGVSSFVTVIVASLTLTGSLTHVLVTALLFLSPV